MKALVFLFLGVMLSTTAFGQTTIYMEQYGPGVDQDFYNSGSYNTK